MVLPRVTTVCWHWGTWETGGWGTTNITAPWGTAGPTRMGCGRAGRCGRTWAWMKAEITPGCPLTGNIWQMTGGAGTGGGDTGAAAGDEGGGAALSDQGEPPSLLISGAWFGEGRAEAGGGGGGGLWGWFFRSCCRCGEGEGACGGGASLWCSALVGGMCCPGDRSAVWRMTLVAMALHGGGAGQRG